MSIPPAPPDNEAPRPWDALKTDPAVWQAVWQYSHHVLKGSGKRIKELEIELEQARQQAVTYGQNTLSQGEQQFQHEQLHASVEASLTALEGQVPEERRTLIPVSLAPAERLQWLTANLGLLTDGRQGPAVPVHSGPPRRGGTPRSSAEEARARALKSLGFSGR